MSSDNMDQDAGQQDMDTAPLDGAELVPAAEGDMDTISFMSATNSDYDGDQRCGHCSNTYDNDGHRAMSGQCGHVAGSSCWQSNANVCGTCSKQSGSLEPTYALFSPRDLCSPQPIDPTQPMGNDNGGPGDGSKMAGMQQQTAAGTLAAAASSMAPSAAAPSVVAPFVVAPSMAAPTVATPPRWAAPAAPTIPAPRRAAPAAPTIPAPRRAAAPAGPPEGPNGMANITVKCMNGHVVKRTLNPSKTTVAALKRIVEDESGISSRRQSLLYLGKPMSDDGKFLSYYKVVDGAIIQMGTQNNGG